MSDASDKLLTRQQRSDLRALADVPEATVEAEKRKAEAEGRRVSISRVKRRRCLIPRCERRRPCGQGSAAGFISADSALIAASVWADQREEVEAEEQAKKLAPFEGPVVVYYGLGPANACVWLR